MKIKTSELTGAALNWAVASIEWPNDTGILYPGLVDKQSVNEEYPFDKDWSLTGPIIERSCITLDYQLCYGETKMDWEAISVNDLKVGGVTPLIAALRCHVANKRGDEVEVPDHLL